MSKKHKAAKGKNQDGYLSKGKLEITRSGVGYVVMQGEDNDVLVRPNNFLNALNGDTVRVKIIRENGRGGKREGEVTEVVSRKQNEFIGHLQVSANFAFFIPDGGKQLPDLYIPLDKLSGAKDKDRVLARLTNWDKQNKKPEGEVIQLVTAKDESDIAMKELLVENGFPLVFNADVMEEADRLPDTIIHSEIKKRKDCRQILTFTIDPFDAKDFDDAISIQKLKGDMYEIGVHIADVSHYVEPGTELDDEAYRRATSVYMPDRVNPMLPEKISNGLCSLRPHEDKLTFSAIFQMNSKGQVKEHWLGRTVTHSDHRFTYEDVQEIIEKKEGEHSKEIILLNELAQTFRAERFKHGAINFSSTEVRFKLDEDGKPIGVVVKESKESHQLVEEFMLLANRTVAEYIGKQKINKKEVPFPYRIHDTPDEEKLKPFMIFAAKYGHKFDTSSPDKIASSFNQMLEDVKGKPEEHVLQQLGIRTMAKAVYSPENIGHYGLAFENYCHFTSPIRRYPDVIVHRVLQSCLDAQPIFDKAMETKCKHCSDMERSAMDVERASNKYKQVEFLKDHIGEVFLGVVSGVAGFGFWVETVEHKCEGLISINSLSDYDDFRVIESDYALVGRRSGRRFRMGDKLHIKVISANLGRRQLDFEWVMNADMEEEEIITPEKMVKKVANIKPKPKQKEKRKK